jgi:D-alanine-D-alanine ligase
VPGAERIRLVVLFGGRSAEHDVSCVSALHVLGAVDRDRYDVEPVGITHDGRWVTAGDAVAALAAGATALPSPDGAPATAEVEPLPAVAPTVPGQQVVVLPLLHGPMGEDGTVQGLCELAGVPYVGAGVAASALCMDKGLAKEVLAANGLPQCDHVVARRPDGAFADEAASIVGLPCFVKPANMGSSVGVTKAHDVGELRAGVELALRYDEYVVVEEAVDGREIEVAVLGNESPRASVPGEIVPGREFYDYDDKYLSEGADLLVPAKLGDDEVAEVQRLAVAAYRSLRVDGMARVDFFYEEGGRGWLVNELNTIPGFTPISMYPKLWEASGLPYAALVDELVRLAIERHERRARFSTHHEFNRLVDEGRPPS